MRFNSLESRPKTRRGALNLVLAFLVVATACGTAYVMTGVDIPFISLQQDHSEQTGLAGATGLHIINCLPNNHIESIVGSDGVLGIYVLNKTAQRVVDVESQTLTIYAKAIGEQVNSTKILLDSSPQEGDGPGRTSRFEGQLPEDLIGRALWVSVPNLVINGERFRFAFAATDKEIKPQGKHSEEVTMPEKASPKEEEALYLTAEGRYTIDDIELNGRTTSSQKYKGVKSEHDMSPKSGDRICPITRTKANPKFSWIVDGKTYTFCCPPCIDEFVASARAATEPLPDPESFLKE